MVVAPVSSLRLRRNVEVGFDAEDEDVEADLHAVRVALRSGRRRMEESMAADVHDARVRGDDGGTRTRKTRARFVMPRN